MKEIRTRIAPSPTGNLHIGHLRTILYNYAYAREFGGKFIVRIEDTDRNRFVEGVTEKTLETIRDYGFEWDEFYIQSERLDIYRKYAEELVDKGLAYRCFCTKERLDEVRGQQRSQGLPKTMYDGHCRNLSEEINNRSHVIRLKVPRNEKIIFVDEVWGKIEFDSNEIDDTVLLKSDGFPTYHLAVVIDDHLMNISHIIRGNDWLPSAPKHVLLYKAFGWEIPVHIHLPNLKEKGQNRKLSKRFGSVTAADFLKEGYLPEAMANFLMFLGWNPGTEKEIYSMNEFIRDFDIKKIHKTDLVSLDRDKLLWINGFYIRNMSVSELVKRLKKHGVERVNEKIVSLVQKNLKVLSEFEDLTEYFFEDPKIDVTLSHKYAKDKTEEIVENFKNFYDNTDDWIVDNLDKISHDFIEKIGYTPKEAFMTLRVVLTGRDATPPLFEVLEILGKETVLRRLGTVLYLNF